MVINRFNLCNPRRYILLFSNGAIWLVEVRASSGSHHADGSRQIALLGGCLGLPSVPKRKMRPRGQVHVVNDRSSFATRLLERCTHRKFSLAPCRLVSLLPTRELKINRVPNPRSGQLHRPYRYNPVASSTANSSALDIHLPAKSSSLSHHVILDINIVEICNFLLCRRFVNVQYTYFSCVLISIFERMLKTFFFFWDRALIHFSPAKPIVIGRLFHEAVCQWLEFSVTNRVPDNGLTTKGIVDKLIKPRCFFSIDTLTNIILFVISFRFVVSMQSPKYIQRKGLTSAHT